VRRKIGRAQSQDVPWRLHACENAEASPQDEHDLFSLEIECTGQDILDSKGSICGKVLPAVAISRREGLSSHYLS